MPQSTPPYEPTDEVFRYINDNPGCQITDLENHIRGTYPFKRFFNVRPILITLEKAGLIHVDAASTYVSIMPFGEEIIKKDGLYSVYLKRLEKEKAEAITPPPKVSFVQKYWWAMLLFGWVGGCVTDLGKKAIEKRIWPELQKQQVDTLIVTDTVYIPYFDTSGAKKPSTK